LRALSICLAARYNGALFSDIIQPAGPAVCRACVFFSVLVLPNSHSVILESTVPVFTKFSGLVDVRNGFTERSFVLRLLNGLNSHVFLRDICNIGLTESTRSSAETERLCDVPQTLNIAMKRLAVGELPSKTLKVITIAAIIDKPYTSITSY